MRAATTPSLPRAAARCRLCRVELGQDATDDLTRQLCSSCKTRPEATTLKPRRINGTGAPAPAPPAARPFTPAERALIRQLQSHLPAAEVLAILNVRLVADQGPATPRHTLEDLQAAIAEANPAAEASADWAALRQLLAEARRAGTLAALTPTVLQDFATVYRLTPAQLVHLQDVIGRAQEPTP